MKKYRLDAIQLTPSHATFTVFDPWGANCGALTILRSDVMNFISHAWKGDIAWRNIDPFFLEKDGEEEAKTKTTT